MTISVILLLSWLSNKIRLTQLLPVLYSPQYFFYVVQFSNVWQKLKGITKLDRDLTMCSCWCCRNMLALSWSKRYQPAKKSMNTYQFVHSSESDYFMVACAWSKWLDMMKDSLASRGGKRNKIYCPWEKCWGHTPSDHWVLQFLLKN